MPQPDAMRENLERKCRRADLAAAESALRDGGAVREGTQDQLDTYFRVPTGRLKLREIAGAPAVLIWYERPTELAVRLSQYYLVPVADPVLLRAALTAALGVRGVVRKRRTIYHFHNVRIHLDEVAGLGNFLELEAVLSAEAAAALSRQRLETVERWLKWEPAQDLAGSYADLLGL